MNPLHHITPTLTLPHPTQGQLLLKMEAHQPSGSFKLRGVGLLAQRAHARGARRLIASSGGNAGLAAAYAARALGLAADIFVPQTTPRRIQHLLQREGARVVATGAVWDEAHQAALREADDPHAAFVHPFDHPDLWEGHATLVHELALQAPKPDRIFLSVGGGGLLCGVLQGLRDVGWEDVPTLAVETHGAHSLAWALQHGAPRPLDAISSVARSLGALAVAPEALRRAQRHPVTSCLVHDHDALRACVWAAEHLRVLVEPACGAALAAALDPEGHAATPGRSAVIVCGGAHVTPQELAQWMTV